MTSFLLIESIRFLCLRDSLRVAMSLQKVWSSYKKRLNKKNSGTDHKTIIFLETSKKCFFEDSKTLNLRWTILIVWKSTEFKHIRDEKTSADAIIFLVTEKDIRDLGSIQKPKTFIVIGIAGTYELGDIAQDLKVFQTKFEDTDAKVHSGFYGQFIALKPRVESVLETILKDTFVDEILITGHSLGGAVSAMFGASLPSKFESQNFRVVTFGCPKPGNSKFRELFQQRFQVFLCPFFYFQ